MENQDSRLLVVDDDERNRDILSRQLRRRGYEVLLADSGERALALVESEPVDLVILDIMMPGIDGIEVLERLRKKHSPAQLPIVMATAKTDSQDIVQCAELGANDHVGKPFDFDVIGAKVSALLKLKAAATPMPVDDAEPTLADLGPGSLLAGKYRLEKQIGSGNFGAVYRARHQELDLEVAIKVLLGNLANDKAIARFRREGVAACRVRHPNAVAVSDYGVTATGVAYMVMELLEGRSLDRELQRARTLSPLRANEIVQPVCDVLAEAHGRGLVHRDIKPENVFLHQTGRGEVVKLLDFGIAKLVGEATLQENLTAEGWILGTPAYMAPERFSGQHLDGGADVYSLGIMTFEALTGRKPFRTPNKDPMSIITQHVNKAPPTLRSIDPRLPEELEEPIARALAKKSRDRPDAATFARLFARGVERVPAAGAAVQAPRPGTQPLSKDLGRDGSFLRRWLNRLRRA